MQRNLNTATNAVNTALQRMSTGYKINSAKDDAAGMYVASHLNSQIRGLKQAQKNVQDGYSILQTAEGAYNNISNILFRLRELSLQASSSYYDEKSRQAMQLEADELTAQLRQIQDGTTFNGLSLFNNPPTTGAGAGTPILANTLNLMDLNNTGVNGATPSSVNSESTSTPVMMRSASPMMRSTALSGVSGNEGIALMSVDGGATPASTITSTAYDFTASQTQTITIGEGEHQRTYTVKNREATTKSLTVNYDTSTGQITFYGTKFEIRATELDKTHNLVISGTGNYVYTGNMADTIEVIGGTLSNENYIYAKDGNDTLISNAQNTRLYGQAGEDIIYLTHNSSTAYGGTENDTIYVTNSTYCSAYGNEGNDKVYIDVNTSTTASGTKAYGDAGDDEFYLSAQTKYATINGGDGDNKIEDLGSNNTKINLKDFSGNDVSTSYSVDFSGINDTKTITIDGKNYEVTCGSNTYKTLAYTISDGVITFDATSPYFKIKAQEDVAHNVILLGGQTTFYGGSQNDTITVGIYNCTIYAGAGDDNIKTQNDGGNGLKVYGEAGKDNILLHNNVYGAASIIDGGDNDDTITIKSTTTGYGKLYGGNGDDTINIEGSQYVAIGGNGNDTYNFKAGTTNNAIIDNNENGDTNTINANGTEVLTSGFNDSKATVVSFGAGETKTITLANGNTYEITNTMAGANDFAYFYDPITFETNFMGSFFTITGETDKTHTINLYGDNNKLYTGDEIDNVILYGNYNDIYTYGENDNITHNGWLNNNIYAGEGDDNILLNKRTIGGTYGENGNDKITINGLNSQNIQGGAGNDEYILNANNGKLTDTEGSNVFEINANNCLVNGGTGDDTFTVNGDNNTIDAASGNDYVLLNGANNTVLGGTGTNYYVATSPEIENSNTISNTVVNPNSGAVAFTSSGAVETFEFGGQVYTVTNTGADGSSVATNTVTYNYNQNTGELTLSGSNFTVTTQDTNQNLVIKGSNNSINTGNGNDKVLVASGEGNVINTNGGADNITINANNNAVTSGDGDDKITLNGTSGSKLIDTGIGNNTLVINSSNNTNINAGQGNDNLTVTGNENTITLGDGSSTAVMTGTNNTINAGNGNNKLSSVNGNNTINVGSGNNTIGLQGNNNTATTLNGNNTFNVNGDTNSITTQGNGTYNITGSDNTIDSQNGNGNYTIKGNENTISATSGTQKLNITGNSNEYSLTSGVSDVKIKGNLNKVTTNDGNNEVDVKGDGNTIKGGVGADTISISGNGNTATGGDGDDYLMINSGASNVVDGEAGDNVLINGGVNTSSQNVTDMTPTPLHVQLQIGANATDNIEFDLSFNLFNFEIDFTDTESSLESLEKIDDLLSQINNHLANVGALMNRLDSVSQSQITQIENYTAAMSTIIDADIAQESAIMIKNQILQQTTATLMAQAKNVNYDIVMRLLGNL